MRDLPLKKLRNFGGKLGAEMEAMGCTIAGQVSGAFCVSARMQAASLAGFCACHSNPCWCCVAIALCCHWSEQLPSVPHRCSLCHVCIRPSCCIIGRPTWYI